MLNLITIDVCRYNLHTVRQVVIELRWIPRSCSCSSNEMPPQQTAGDEVSPRQNGRRRSVFATKWLGAKCTRDEMVGDKMYSRQNGGNKAVVAKWQRRNVLLHIKQALKAIDYDGPALSQWLCSFLLAYQTTSHATTGVSPCSLSVKWNLHTRLDLLRPNRTLHVLHKQSLQKDLHNWKAKDRSWYIGHTIHPRNLRPHPD